MVPEAHLPLAWVSKKHFISAGLFLSSEVYRSNANALKDRGDTIILGTGVFDYYSDRYPVFHTGHIKAIISELQPDLLVLPCAKRDTPNFNGDILSGLDSFAASESDFLLPIRSTRWNLLEQEMTFYSTLECSRIKALGLPKEMEQLAEGNEGGRANFLISPLIGKGWISSLDIWLLGAYKDPLIEFLSVKKHKRVIGGDSSKPWRICNQFRTVSEARPYPPEFDFKQDEVDETTYWFINSQFQELIGHLK